MSKVSLLIIDDEKDARELVKYHLSSITDVDILGEAENGIEAIDLINSLKPDCILLDIEMPEMSGLDIVNRLNHVPQIIFITAYNDYAVRAFEIHAVDYLLKPFDPNRLQVALDRVKFRLSNDLIDRKELTDILKELTKKEQISHLSRIPVKNRLKTEYVDVRDIILLEATDQYITLQTESKNYLVRNSMDYFEASLDSNEFIRTHRSYIISIHRVEAIEQYSAKTSIIHLKGGFKAKLSQSRKVSVEHRLKLT